MYSSNKYTQSQHSRVFSRVPCGPQWIRVPCVAIFICQSVNLSICQCQCQCQCQLSTWRVNFNCQFHQLQFLYINTFIYLIPALNKKSWYHLRPILDHINRIPPLFLFLEIFVFSSANRQRPGIPRPKTISPKKKITEHNTTHNRAKKSKYQNKKKINLSTFNLLRTPLRSTLTRFQSTPTLQEPSLTTTSIEMIRDISRLLARSEHTASHFIAVSIHYSQTVSGGL